MSKGKFLVVGGSGTIGREVCRSLVGKGFDVVAGVRDLEKASDVDALESVKLLEVDAEDWDSVETFVAKADEEEGGISGVAVCVGSILLKPAHLTSKEEYDSVVSLNLSTCFGVLRSVAKRMMKNGGSIVFVSSAAARLGIASHEAIAAAKAGLIGLAQSAAATYASYGIRVNCVAPGLVDTAMAQNIVKNPASLKASTAMHALGRIGNAEEVGRAIAWLLDPEQSWITGQTLGVDGGLGNVLSKRR